MTYFTSDQHFGRFNIIRLCNRPFASLEEMNETMLARWNAKVKDSDRGFVIGDLFFRARLRQARPVYPLQTTKPI